ncbi:ATP-binding protein, partial [Nitrospirales bacterium NOB]|nr:ATP-binding protein [Nitrospirales bacterium NOB]
MPFLSSRAPSRSRRSWCTTAGLMTPPYEVVTFTHNRLCRIAAPHVPTAPAHRGQPLRIAKDVGHRLSQGPAGQLALRQQHRPAGLHHHLRISQLMVIDGRGQWNKNGRRSGGIQLSNGHGAGSRDHQVRCLERSRHVEEKGTDLRRQAGRFIRRLHAGEIRLETRAANGAVELLVADEGEGFPPELLPAAFRRFARADEARSGGGAGLGLAI